MPLLTRQDCKVGTHEKVQLWAGGPYWATTNIGAEKAEEYGYYFWWGDVVGYKRENGAWVASDGSSLNFSFESANAPTHGKAIATLQDEGWITADGVLAPAHDAAHVHWGGGWRMPTYAEISALISNCDGAWTTNNGVTGYVFRGKGDYAANSIFLPCAGGGLGTALYAESLSVDQWSSVPYLDDDEFAYYLVFFHPSYSGWYEYFYRCNGRSVRPVYVPLDLSTLTADYEAQDGDILIGETTFKMTIPVGATSEPLTFAGCVQTPDFIG